jgi:periplasmic copper chaperone A
MQNGLCLIRRPGLVAARIAMLVGLASVSPLLMAADTGPTLSDGWFRVLTPQVPAAGYFVLTNPSDQALVLTGASSPACGTLMLHESIETNGTARMAMAKNVSAPAHGRIEFRPGGYHLMCMSPTSQLTPGQTVPVSLRFQDGASVSATFRVLTAKGR